MKIKPVRIPTLPSYVNKGIRIDIGVVDEIERIICGKECTFSAFVREALRYTLDALYEEEQQKNGQP